MSAKPVIDIAATVSGFANAADRQTYTDMKGPFVLSILERAKRSSSKAVEE
jgi:hypothetical protein